MGFYRKFSRLIMLGALLIAPSAWCQQDLQAIAQKVSDYLQSHYAGSAKKLTVNVNQLDPRLQLSACTQPLEISVRDTSGNGGAVSARVECHSPNPWAIYVGAQVDLYHQVVVASRPLARGERLHQDTVELALMNTSQLRQGYLTTLDSVQGLVIKRHLQANEPLRQGILEQPVIVSRGQTVTLESEAGAINVATQAEALSNGRLGDQIRVRNLSSQRVIRADVVGEGRVAASF
ncbi:MAG TPA: flagellar basal body P-ring formation chaperone FlgA [Cellvibrionaceae bacterium]